jgi:MFS family permease
MECLSVCFWMFAALSQIPGGYLNSKIGGRKVLPVGVGLWSIATAVVPLVGSVIPGAHSFIAASLQLLGVCVVASQEARQL